MIACAILCFTGCASLDLAQVHDGLTIGLDANALAHVPDRRIKFMIDIENGTQHSLDVHNLKIELQVNPLGDRDSISLRQSWKYRWPSQPPEIAPGKRLSISVVPEVGSGEFPLGYLSQGEYEVVALVNDRHRSQPYSLKVFRPDLDPGWRRRQARRHSTERNLHRSFHQPQPSGNTFRRRERRTQ